jgi:hypothetical protein
MFTMCAVSCSLQLLGWGLGLFLIGEYSGSTRADWLETVLLKGRHRQNTLGMEDLPQLLVLQTEKIFFKEKCGK